MLCSCTVEAAIVTWIRPLPCPLDLGSSPVHLDLVLSLVLEVVGVILFCLK